MIWDLYQNTAVKAVVGAAVGVAIDTVVDSPEPTTERTTSRPDRYTGDVADLRNHVERLSLASQAMWELLQNWAGITEAELETKMIEIDARDGRIDGKMGTAPISCPACGRTTSSTRDTCVMCGAPTRRKHQFES